MTKSETGEPDASSWAPSTTWTRARTIGPPTLASMGPAPRPKKPPFMSCQTASRPTIDGRSSMRALTVRVGRAAVVTIAQAAAILGVDARTVSRAIHNGELPALRLGRRLLIPRVPLLACLGASDGLAEDDAGAVEHEFGERDPAAGQRVALAVPPATHASAPNTHRGRPQAGPADHSLGHARGFPIPILILRAAYRGVSGCRSAPVAPGPWRHTCSSAP